ncbi:MAG: NADPH-dependent FMN reductase [Pseudomonadota bacterium]
MTEPVRVLVFAGSLRKDSWNKKLSKQLAGFARDVGAEVTWIDLVDYPMPLFDEDVEAAEFPAEAKAFKQLMCDHDAFIIACPEYNSSITAVLKNAIDWASRKTEPEEAPLKAFAGKVVALAGASPGGFGGLRALVPVRMLLGNIGCLVLPQQVAVPAVHNQIDEQGELVEGAVRDNLKNLAETLVDTARRQKAD